MHTSFRTRIANNVPHPSLAALLSAPLITAVMAGAGAPPELDRYAPRDPLSLTVPRQTVTRRDYVDFLRPYAREFQAPPADAWAPGHGPLNLMPPLAVFAFDGGRLRRAQLRQGTFLKIGAETIFQQADRGNWAESLANPRTLTNSATKTLH